jgi:glycerol-3-phosphate acyltransferase PlsY
MIDFISINYFLAGYIVGSIITGIIVNRIFMKTRTKE